MSFKGGDEIELHRNDDSDLPQDQSMDVIEKIGLMEYLTHLQALENELKVFTFHPKSHLLNDIRDLVNLCKDKVKDETFGTPQDLDDYKLPSLGSLYITVGEKSPPRVMAAKTRSSQGRSSSRGSRTSRSSSYRQKKDIGNVLSSSDDDDEDVMAKKQITVKTSKRVSDDLMEVMGDKFSLAQLNQIKDLMMATNFKNSNLPSTSGLVVEPPTNWPRDLKGGLVENTMDGLSANNQVIHSQLINTQFTQLRKKYNPALTSRDKRESITEFLEGVKYFLKKKAALSRNEFRNTFPTFFWRTSLY